MKTSIRSAIVAEFDAIVGRLLDKLQQLGVADNTLLIVAWRH